MGGHVFPARVLDAPPSMIDTFCEGSLTFTTGSFTSRESLSPAAIRVHGIKMVGNIRG